MSYHYEEKTCDEPAAAVPVVPAAAAAVPAAWRHTFASMHDMVTWLRSLTPAQMTTMVNTWATPDYGDDIFSDSDDEE